jgi:hypothetical protein
MDDLSEHSEVRAAAEAARLEMDKQRLQVLVSAERIYDALKVGLDGGATQPTYDTKQVEEVIPASVREVHGRFRVKRIPVPESRRIVHQSVEDGVVCTADIPLGDGRWAVYSVRRSHDGATTFYAAGDRLVYRFERDGIGREFEVSSRQAGERQAFHSREAWVAAVREHVGDDFALRPEPSLADRVVASVAERLSATR